LSVTGLVLFLFTNEFLKVPGTGQVFQVSAKGVAIFGQMIVFIMVFTELVLPAGGTVSSHWPGALKIVLILYGLQYPALGFIKNDVDVPGFASFDGLLMVRLGTRPGGERVPLVISAGLAFVELGLVILAIVTAPVAWATARVDGFPGVLPSPSRRSLFKVSSRAMYFFVLCTSAGMEVGGFRINDL
jgi:hypothetical protein